MTEIPITQFNPAGPTPDEVRVVVQGCDYQRGADGISRCVTPSHEHERIIFPMRRRPGMAMRRFIVWRPDPPEEYRRDGLTYSGEQPDIEGVQFSDGTVSIRWMVKDRQSFSNWESFAVMEAVHGHPEYGTRIEWLDP